MEYLVVVLVIMVLISNVVSIMVFMRHAKHKATVPVHPTPLAKLSRETIAHLEQQTEAAFKTSVEQASQHFDEDIDKTSQTLNELIVRLTTSVVEEELTRYREGLSEARVSALKSLTSMQKTVEDQQMKLQADMEAAITQRQTELLERLDKKIGVIATHYIVEALGQGADLGAQREYLLDSLERNKESLKKDIVGEL